MEYDYYQTGQNVNSIFIRYVPIDIRQASLFLFSISEDIKHVPIAYKKEKMNLV